MDLVNVCLYAEAYYSGAEYEENIWIKKSSYEKLMDDFPEEISCGELDGKYSEVIGDVSIQDNWKTDEEYAKAGTAKCDGDYLKDKLKYLYKSNNLNWEEEQQEIEEYFNNLDVWEDITVSIPASKVGKLLSFVYKLRSN